jgi:hypothetical protein
MGIVVISSIASLNHLFRASVDVTRDLSEAGRAQLQHAAEVCPAERTFRREIAIEARVFLNRCVDAASEESFPASDPLAW